MGKKPTSHTFSHLYYSATMTSLFWRLRQKDRAGNGNVLGQDLSVKRQQRIQDLSVKRQQRIHDLSVKRQQRIHDLSVKGQLRIHLGHFVSLRLCFVCSCFSVHVCRRWPQNKICKGYRLQQLILHTHIHIHI